MKCLPHLCRRVFGATPLHATFSPVTTNPSPVCIRTGISPPGLGTRLRIWDEPWFSPIGWSSICSIMIFFSNKVLSVDQWNIDYLISLRASSFAKTARSSDAVVIINYLWNWDVFGDVVYLFSSWGVGDQNVDEYLNLEKRKRFFVRLWKARKAPSVGFSAHK